MKKLSIFPFALFVALSTRLAAEEPGSSFGLAPGAAPRLEPSSIAPANVPLIPDASALTPDKPTATPTATDDDKKPDKPNQTVVEEDKLRKRIQMRQALTKAQRDPGLQQMLADAAKAKTDFEQRKIYTDYYNQLCALVGKIDKTINKDDLEELRKGYIARYMQVRIAPTIDPATFRKPRN